MYHTIPRIVLVYALLDYDFDDTGRERQSIVLGRFSGVWCLLLD